MKNYDQNYEEYQNDTESPRIIPDKEKAIDSNRKPLNQQPSYDKLINDGITLQSNRASQKEKVAGRSMIPEIFIIGSCGENPKLNSVVHDSEFSNG